MTPHERAGPPLAILGGAPAAVSLATVAACAVVLAWRGPTEAAPGSGGGLVAVPLRGVITEADAGQVFAAGQTWRFELVLDADVYPPDALRIACEGDAGLGGVTNAQPRDPPHYGRRYQTGGAGTCSISNGAFWVAIVVAGPDPDPDPAPEAP